MTGHWDILVPEAAVNIIVDPVLGEDAASWSPGGGGAGSRSSTRSRFGAYSYEVVTGGNAFASGLYDTSTAVDASSDYTLTIWVYATIAGIPLSIRATGDDSGNHTAAYTSSIGWERYELTFTTSAGDTAMSSGQVFTANDTTAHTYYLDAIQLEKHAYATTYCDGNQDGCEWDGEAHDSSSSRSAVTRAGGHWYNLEDEYSVIVTSYLGVGMAPRATTRDGYSQLPGGVLNNSVRTSRTFTLVSLIKSTTFADLLDKRNALIKVLSPEAYPSTAEGLQPVRVRNTGGTTDKVISAHYEGGLETDQTWALPINERVAIRFFAPDPNWYEVGESSQVLTTRGGDGLRYLAGRLRSTRKWDPLGLTANPTAGGTIWTICVARDKSVYFGGDFDGIDNNVPAGGDYIIRWDPSDESLNLLVGASDVNEKVFVISEGPDGKIYLGGDFTAVNGVGTADYIVAYDPSTDTWSSLGDPDSGGDMLRVQAMAWDSSGNLYIGGQFAGVAGVADTGYFAKWDGTNWTAIGSVETGATIATIYSIVIDKDDNIFIGGSFSNIAGDANADNWAWWNGTAWAAVDDISLNGAVRNMAIDEMGDVYVGGLFTDADGVANTDKIFKWTGTAVEALDSGVNDTVYQIRIAPDGNIWAAGAFTVAGTISVVDRIAIWNGSSWIAPDVNLPGAPVVFGMAFGKQDPTVPENYDIYIGLDTTGTGYYAGLTTVTNDGTATVYPQIVVNRSGGTLARLVSVRNWTTGSELFFDYSLVDGETLTIDLHPDKQTIESSFYGSRLDALLAGSDLGEFSLLASANDITTFVDVAGAPTITAYMLWQDAYDGIDD